MNVTLTDLTGLAASQFWQVTAVCLLVGLVTRLACRHRPHLAYLLWMLVVIKAITPPILASPTGLFSWIKRDAVPLHVAATVDPSAHSNAPSLAPAPLRPARGARRQPSPTGEDFDLAPLPIRPAQHPAEAVEQSRPKPASALLSAGTLLVVWLAGLLGLLLLIAAKWWRIRRDWLAQASSGDGALEEAVAQLASQLNVRRRVRVVVSSAVDTPAVFGVWRPIILLPADLVAQMPTEALRPILAHELIHVRRGDLPAAMLQLAAQLAWWFHPLVWWVNREARRERERACDEEVVAGLGCKAGDYARSLLTVLEARAASRSLLPLPALGMFGVTARRLEHIIRRAGQFHRRTPKAYYALALVALALLLPGAGLKVVGQAPTEEATKAAADKAPQPVVKPANPAGEKALARLRALGADGPEGIDINGSRFIYVAIGRKWKGTDADLGLLDRIVALGNVSLSITFDRVSPEAFSAIKLHAPLDDLSLDAADPHFMQLTALPACRELGIDAAHITPAIYRQLVAIGTGVESLWLSGQYYEEPSQGVHDADLAELAAMASLKTLKITDSPITDAGLGQLAAMEHLESLELERCGGLSVSDLSGLVVLDRLRSLSVDWPISGAALKNIARLGSLETLSFQNAGLEPADFEPIAALSYLRKLSIAWRRNQGNPVRPKRAKGRLPDTTLGDAIARVVGKLPNLRELNLEMTIDNEGLDSLIASGKMQSLMLDLAEVDDRTLALASRLPDLQVFYLAGQGKLSDQSLAHLEKSTKLERLRLPGSGLTDLGLAHLAGLARLHDLSLSGSQITGSGLVALERSTNLKSLYLHRGAFDDAGCQLLPTLFPRLELVDLWGTKITDAGVASLATLPDLNFLAIDETAVTSAGLVPLEGLKHLQHFSVSRGFVDRAAITRLMKAKPDISIAWNGGKIEFGAGVFDYLRDRSTFVPDFKPAADDAAPVVTNGWAAGRSGPAPATGPADTPGEKALARLGKLGATCFDQIDESGEREIQIALDREHPGLSWKGTDADLALLADVQTLGKLNLDIDLSVISPQAVSQLKLPKRLGTLFMQHATDKTFAELTSLPDCHGCALRGADVTPTVCRRLAELLPHVESLQFIGAAAGHADGYTDDEMAELRRQAILPGADVWHGLDDNGLAELAVLQQLEDLEMVNSPVTGAGLKHLAGMKRLKTLFVWDCSSLETSDLAALAEVDSLRRFDFAQPVSAAGLANVARLEKLESFSADLSGLKPEEAAPLARLSHLEKLSVDASSSSSGPEAGGNTPEARQAKVPLGDALARAAGQIPSLRVVSLSIPSSNEGLAALTASGKLQSARLALAEVNDRSLELVSRSPALRQLRLTGPGKLSDRGLAHLEKLTRLIDLKVPGAGITDEGFVHLADLTAVQYLDLSGGRFSGAGLAALNRWKSLKTLALVHSSFDDAGCRVLPQFASLEQLELFGTKITDAGLESIGKIPELRELSVYDTAVTDAGVAQLEALKHLEKVLAMGTAVSQGGSDAFRTASASHVWIVADAATSSDQDADDSEEDEGISFPSGGPFRDEEPTLEEMPADGEPDDLGAIEDQGEGAPAGIVPAPASGQFAVVLGGDQSESATALARLKQLGADWEIADPSAHAGDGFPHNARLVIHFDDNWKGTAEDWKLLERIDDPAHLQLSLYTDRLDGLADVHFARPLAGIVLQIESPERLERIKQLPACRTLLALEKNLTLSDYRRLFALAGQIDRLSIEGVPANDDGSATADDVAAEIAALPKKPTLLTIGAPLTDVGIRSIAKIAGLTHLDLNISSDDPAAIEPLAGLAHLQTLTVRGNQSRLNPPDPQEQARHQLVRLQGVPLGDGLARLAGKMPSLRQFDSQAPLDEKGLAALVANQSLQSLSLDLAEVDDRSLEAISKLGGLQRLVLRGPGKLTDSGLAALEKLTRLVQLELPANGLTDAGLVHLAGLVKMQELSLSEGNITGTGLAALAGLKSLTSLTLSDSPFDDDGCRRLSQFPALRSLNLSSTKITDAALASLAGLPELHRLNIVADQGITNSGLVQLEPLKKLRWIAASGTQITKEAATALQQAIPGLIIDHRPGGASYTFVVGDAFPGTNEAPKTEATAADAADQKAVLEELGRRGAQVSAGFAVGGPIGPQNQTQIQFLPAWKGTDDDWKLLGKLTQPQDVALFVGDEHLAGLAKVKFARPLARITLDLHSGAPLAKIDRLPACRSLFLADQELKLADYARLFDLLPGVDSLTLMNGVAADDKPGLADGVIALVPSHLKHLITLSDNAPVSGAGLAAIGKLAGLKQLWIKTLTIKPADVAPLAKLTHLERLNISPDLAEVNRPDRQGEVPVGDAIAAAIGKTPSLLVVNIETRMSDKGLQALGGAKKLVALMVQLDRISDQSIAAVGGLTSLNVLHLSSEKGKLTDRGLLPLGELTKLLELTLPARGITDAGLAPFDQLTKLRSLTLRNGAFAGAGLGAVLASNSTAIEPPKIQELPNLAQLDVSGGSFNDSGCARLSQFCPHLGALGVDNTKVTDSGMESLAGLSQLSYLNLGGTKLTDAGLEKLKPLKSLRRLTLTRTRVTPAAVDKLAAENPNLALVDDRSPSGTFGYGTLDASAGQPPAEAAPRPAEQPEKPAEKAPTDQQPPADKKPMGQSPASQKALDRLKALGAHWYQMWPLPVSSLVGKLPENLRFGVSFADDWKGNAEDWKLLEAVDEPEHMCLLIATDRLEGLSAVQLTAPVAQILFRLSSGKHLAKLDRLPRCRSLILEEEFLTLDDYRRLISLAPDVEELNLRMQNPRGAFPADELAALITGGMKHLRRLSFSRWPVTGKGLADLATLENLDELWISIAAITPAELQPLARLTHLRRLNIATSGASTKQYADRANEIPWGDAIAQAIAGTPSLRAAQIDVVMGNTGVDAMSRAGKLQILDLALPEVTDARLARLGRLTALRRLQLQGPGELTDAGLAPLETLVRLVDLSLPADRLTDEGLEHLAPLVALQFLELPQGRFTGAGLAALGGLSHLHLLHLAGSRFDDTGCRLLPKVFPELAGLDLSGTKITDAGLPAIAGLSRLGLLVLDETQITDAGLADLAPLKHLLQVRALHTSITAAGVANLKAALPKLDVVDDRSTSYGTFRPSFELEDDEPVEPTDEKL